MFRSKKEKGAKDKDAEKKGGRFTLKRSKSKKRNDAHMVLTHDSSPPEHTGGVPTATVANPQTAAPPGAGTNIAFPIGQGVQARALYEYDPEQDDEIQLKEGDIVIVYERDESGWWTGECRGKYGLFPGAFVELIQGAPLINVALTAQLAAQPAPAINPSQNGSLVEKEALPASASSASITGDDDMKTTNEILSYLEEGLQENGSLTSKHAETSEDLYSSHGSNATAASNQENDTVEESTPDIEKHTDDGTPGVPEDEPVEESHEDHAVESQPSDKQEKAESPSLQNSAKEFHLPPQEKTLSSDGLTIQPDQAGQGPQSQELQAAMQAWEEERVEWEKHAREWEQSYDSLHAEYESVKQENAQLHHQIEVLHQANADQTATISDLGAQIEDLKRANEMEKATAENLLHSLQRVEEQLQEAEREKIQAQASSLSAEANAQELARLHSLLAEETKQREAAQKAMSEEQQRNAELLQRIQQEQDLRLEVEQKLAQADHNASERVAKVEESLLRHLNETKAQLMATIKSQSQQGSSAASAHPAVIHSHNAQHSQARPPVSARPSPPNFARPQGSVPDPAQPKEAAGLRPAPGPFAGAGGQPVARPMAAQPGPGGRGGAPTRGGMPPARGRGGPPLQRPQVPPGSQKPPLAAQPQQGGMRPIPTGATARSALRPPGRPRGAAGPGPSTGPAQEAA